MRGFQSPNYTQVPNDLFDELLSSMEYAELKVLLCILRATFGYHRASARLSIRTIARLTGLTPRSVMAGARALEARGLIIRTVIPGITVTWEAVILGDTPLRDLVSRAVILASAGQGLKKVKGLNPHNNKDRTAADKIAEFMEAQS